MSSGSPKRVYMCEMVADDCRVARIESRLARRRRGGSALNSEAATNYWPTATVRRGIALVCTALRCDALRRPSRGREPLTRTPRQSNGLRRPGLPPGADRGRDDSTGALLVCRPSCQARRRQVDENAAAAATTTSGLAGGSFIYISVCGLVHGRLSVCAPDPSASIVQRRRRRVF